MAQSRPVLTTDPGPQFTQCMDEARKLLDRAAIEWSKGDPSDPGADDVLRSLLAPFIRERFLRPPNGAW